MAKADPLPKYTDFFKPTLDALEKLGGSASIEELEDALTDAMGLTQAQLDLTYPKSGAAIAPDRMSWARSFLKLAGLVENPKRGVWVLTEEGRAATALSNSELRKIVDAAYKASLAAKKAAQANNDGGNEQEGRHRTRLDREVIAALA